MIRVAIRFDDPSPTSDRGIESRLIASLKAAGLRATFAVTPLGGYAAESPALDSANAASLVQGTREGTIEIGLHGHSHVNVRSGHDRSEFAGLGLKAQLERLESARANLRMVFGSSAAAGFIPPWNSYDLATVRALEQLGFESLSGGEYHPPDEFGSVAVIPRTCQFTALESVIPAVRRLKKFSPHVIAVLHHYDFKESGEDSGAITIDNFRRTLDWLCRQPDVEVMTLAGMVRALGPSEINRLSRRWLAVGNLHWRLRDLVPRKALVDAPAWSVMWRSTGLAKHWPIST